MLQSVEDLAAFRTRGLNVIVGSNSAEPVQVAEISAAAFRVTGYSRCWEDRLSRPMNSPRLAILPRFLFIIQEESAKAR